MRLRVILRLRQSVRQHNALSLQLTMGIANLGMSLYDAGHVEVKSDMGSDIKLVPLGLSSEIHDESR